MATATQPRPLRPPPRRRPQLARIEEPQRAVRLHLLTYIVGNALFWTLWAAISVTADHWYWWVTVPLAGWTVVLALHLLHAARSSR